MIDSTRRKKPWYRLRNILLAIVAIVVLTLGYVFLESWKVYTAVPQVARDFRAEFRAIGESAAGVQPGDGDEAWALLVAAAESGEQIVAECRQLIRDGSIEARVHESGDPDLEIVFGLVLDGSQLPESLIKAERHALDMMRDQGVFEALKSFAEIAPGFRRGNHAESMMLERFSELTPCRTLAKARAASMRLSMAEGDVSDACDGFDELMAMAQTLSLQPGLIFHLVAQSIAMLATSEMNHLLAEYEFDGDSAKRLLATLQERRLADGAFALNGERSLFHDFVQRHFSDDGAGDGFLNAGSAASIAGSDSVHEFLGAVTGRFFLATRAETLTRYDQFIDQCIAETRVPLVRRWQRGFDPDQINLKDWGFRYALLNIMLPAVQKAIDNVSRIEQQVEAMRVMAALELYQAVHRRLPDSLDELTPGLLPERPIDPLHGGNFGYRLLTDDPHQRTFLLYSTGVDENDDGGATPSDPDDRYSTLIPRKPLRGFDYIFNLPREKPVLDH